MEGRKAHRASSVASFVWEHFKFNLASAMEYRRSFVLQVVFMIINDFMLLFFWWIIFTKVDDIGGWTFRNMITMQAVVAASYGLSASLFGNALRIPAMIVEGQLDYYLLLPREPLLHMLVSRSDISGLGDLAFGLIAFCVFTGATAGKLALFVLVIVAASVVFACYCVIVGSLAFFIGNAQTVSQQLTNAMITFGGYPEPVFKGIVRAVLYSIIPVGFMAYLPVSLLSNLSLSRLAMFLAFTAFSIWAAKAVFAAGLARYESGNLVTAKL